MRERFADRLDGHRSPTEGHHSTLGLQRIEHSLLFAAAELCLAIFDEDVRNRFPCRGSDRLIGIAEIHAEPTGE